MTKNIIADFQLDIRITGTSKVNFGNFSVIEGQNISIGTCSISDYFPQGNLHFSEIILIVRDARLGFPVPKILWPKLYVSLATIVWQADDGSEIQRSSDLTSELIVSANRTHNGKVGFQKIFNS